MSSIRPASPTTLSVVAPIARWFLCEPEIHPLDLRFIDPLLRRRLSSLAKMTLCAAHACAGDLTDACIVFASRHGELTRTTSLLENLAKGEALSPTLFSLSVLNASAGIFSILRKNTAPATAISAGGASFGYGLLDACLRLAANPAQPVLYVYADEPPPAVYECPETPGDEAHALGVLLRSSAALRITCSVDAADSEAGCETQSRAFLRCLDHGRAEWNEAGKRWSWSCQ